MDIQPVSLHTCIGVIDTGSTGSGQVKGEPVNAQWYSEMFFSGITPQEVTAINRAYASAMKQSYGALVQDGSIDAKGFVVPSLLSQNEEVKNLFYENLAQTEVGEKVLKRQRSQEVSSMGNSQTIPPQPMNPAVLSVHSSFSTNKFPSQLSRQHALEGYAQAVSMHNPFTESMLGVA